MLPTQLKLARSPNVAIYWQEGQVVLEEFLKRERIAASPLMTAVLNAFSTPRSQRNAEAELATSGREPVHRTIEELRRRGFLVPSSTRTQSAPDVARAWAGSFAAAYFHFATRDVAYAENPFGWLEADLPRLTAGSPPLAFKEYRRAPFSKLPSDRKRAAMSLQKALRKRRTVRTFLATPAQLQTVASIVRGTWGATGSLDAGILGRRLLAKTSPSAGARHPIECYIAAWNVRGLAPGLYHYSVRRDGLERLRSGDFRQEAVGAAAGQHWVASAAFVCFLTAVVDRVFWKYASSDAYRLFFLDAGHLAQTFCLLATAAGLGPFTTAAIQESFIEGLLKIDGIREFPLYICGAGVADRSAVEPPVQGLR